MLEYHEDKFSGLGLYTWLASQLQRTYREAYTIADRMARYAEQAYRFEREDYTSQLLSGQYWEAARAGLLAGNRLTLGLQHLEQRYIETDQPKRELQDHFFSLRQWDPKALIELRQTGECKFKVPELFFDLASPGDYRRRLRSVRVTIPAVAGPFVNGSPPTWFQFDFDLHSNARGEISCSQAEVSEHSVRSPVVSMNSLAE